MPTTRRAALAAAPALLAMGSAVAGQSPDAELLRLLREADALERKEEELWDGRPDPHVDLEGFVANDIACKDLSRQRDELLLQAAALPAHTAEGRLAKVLTVRDWIAGYPGATALDHLHRPGDYLAWSLMQDLIRTGGA